MRKANKRKATKRRKLSPRILLLHQLVARGYTPKQALKIVHRYMRFGKFRRALRWRHGYRIGTPATFNQEGALFSQVK